MTPPRLLVTGGAGLVGSAVVAAALADGRFEVHATRHTVAPGGSTLEGAAWEPLDVTDAKAVEECLARLRPALVVHTAIAVAPGALVPVGVDGAVHVAAAAHATGAALLHVSTDMVFDGDHGPYDEDAVPAPITGYGRAKAEAERRVRAAHPAATIVRLPLLYRIDPPDRALAAWLADARAGRGYPLFIDEIRRPAHVADVAQALVLVAAASLRLPGAGDASVPPVLHLPGPVALSRHAFGLGVLEALGLPAALAVAGRSADGAVPRPRVLDLVAVHTPAAFLAPLRSPAEVFSAVRRETPPAGRPGAR